MRASGAHRGAFSVDEWHRHGEHDHARRGCHHTRPGSAGSFNERMNPTPLDRYCQLTSLVKDSLHGVARDGEAVGGLSECALQFFFIERVHEWFSLRMLIG